MIISKQIKFDMSLALPVLELIIRVLTNWSIFFAGHLANFTEKWFPKFANQCLLGTWSGIFIHLVDLYYKHNRYGCA